MGRARKRVKDLMSQVEGLMRAGAMKKPAWLEPMRRAPPPLVPRNNWTKVPKLEFPQDRLANIFRKKMGKLVHDEATIYAFASEQLELIEKGMSEKEAFFALKNKYLDLDTEEFFKTMAMAKDKEYVPLEDQEDIMQEWLDEESEAIKDAMRQEFQEAELFSDRTTSN